MMKDVTRFDVGSEAFLCHRCGLVLGSPPPVWCTECGHRIPKREGTSGNARVTRVDKRTGVISFEFARGG